MPQVGQHPRNPATGHFLPFSTPGKVRRQIIVQCLEKYGPMDAYEILAAPELAGCYIDNPKMPVFYKDLRILRMVDLTIRIKGWRAGTGGRFAAVFEVGSTRVNPDCKKAHWKYSRDMSKRAVAVRNFELKRASIMAMHKDKEWTK